MATATAMEKTTSRRPRIRTLTTRTLESIRPSDTPEVFEAIFLAMKSVYHFLEVPRVILFGLESLVYRTLPSTLELYKTRLLESREYPVAAYLLPIRADRTGHFVLDLNRRLRRLSR